MGDISRIIRKFERLMEHSHEELMEIGRRPRQQVSENPGQIICEITYTPVYNKEGELTDYKTNYKNKL